MRLKVNSLGKEAVFWELACLLLLETSVLLFHSRRATVIHWHLWDRSNRWSGIIQLSGYFNIQFKQQVWNLKTLKWKAVGRLIKTTLFQPSLGYCLTNIGFIICKEDRLCFSTIREIPRTHIQVFWGRS